MRRFAAILLTCATAVNARITVVHSIDRIATQPAFVVATVTNVARREPSSGSGRPAFRWEAALQVHRAFGAPVRDFTLTYVSEDSDEEDSVDLSIGTTALFALKPNESGGWRLFSDSGLNRIVPAIAHSRASIRPANGRAFLIAEIANVLVNGSLAERSRAARFLLFERSWPADLRTAIERRIGSNKEKWFELAATVNPTPDWLVAKTAADPDGVARVMKRHLARDPHGSIDAALALIHGGHQSFLAEALDAASVVASSQAARLIVDHGEDRHFDALLAAFRHAQQHDEPRYRGIYEAIRTSASRRNLRIAAIMIGDRRPWFAGHRYCDFAATLLAPHAGQRFRIPSQMSEQARDEVVAEAEAWLAAN